jgi:uncharacterized membrane protein YfcA
VSAPTEPAPAAGAGGSRGAARAWRLALIGLAAGLFSALFGVGGGVVIVPLLLALLGYGTKEATATSLAAIALTSTVGAAAHGALGNVEWDRALLIGIPAMGGLLLGVALKARLSSTALTYAFAALLAAVAIDLIVTS